jgi:hypothetical protein
MSGVGLVVDGGARLARGAGAGEWVTRWSEQRYGAGGGPAGVGLRSPRR